MMKRRKKTRI